MAEGLSETELKEIKSAYSDFDTNRPPFRFPTREPNYTPDPAYFEVDETRILEIEDRIFHPQESFPKPPEGLAEDHPVKVAWGKLMEAEKDLMTGVELIKLSLEQSSKIKKGEAIDPDVLTEPLGPEGLARLEKRNREDHLDRKKDYFQRAMCYLHLYKNCPDFRDKKEGVEDLLDETELIFLGHVGYATVRSGAHKFGPIRDDGTLVMDHCYKTSVYVINRYLEELRNEKDPQKRRKLYMQVKKGVLVALAHDYIEDFQKMSTDFLKDKLTQQTTWHTDIEGDLRIPQYPGMPKRSNFYRRHETSILRMLEALTKPQPKENPFRKGYLQRQLLDQWEGSIDDQVLCFRAKVGDRLHNQRTVGAKPIEKQADIMLDSGKIIDLGRRIGRQKKGRGKLNCDLKALSTTTLEISSNLLAVKEQLNEVTRGKLIAEVKRIRNLLGDFFSEDLFDELFGN